MGENISYIPMNPSCEEGKGLSTKVKCSVFIEPKKTYVQYYMQQQNEKPTQTY